MKDAPLPDVQVGQIWEDMDKRMTGRKIRVIRLEGRFAVCQNVFVPSLINRIQIRRMKPGAQGYRRVS